MALDTPGDGLSAPIPPARDDADPLSPASLARRELDAWQAIRAWDELRDVARDFINDAGYRHARRAIALHKADVETLAPTILALVESRRATLARAAQLDQSERKNVRYHQEAAEDYEAALAARDRIEALWHELARRLKRESEH